MDEITSIVSSALNSIGAVQPLVIAGLAGFILKDINKIALFVVGALLANSIVSMIRSAIGGANVGTLVQSNISGFFALNMRTLLIYAISFGLVIAVVYAVKLQIKKI